MMIGFGLLAAGLVLAVGTAFAVARSRKKLKLEERQLAQQLDEEYGASLGAAEK